MGRLATRLAGATLVAGALLLALPVGAAATITGGCSVSGTSTSGGTVDLATTSVWHVRSSDQISISGSAPFDQTDGSASVYAFGFAIPLSSGHSAGERSFHSDTYEVSTLGLAARVFVLGGASSGPFHDCAGQVEIVIDDANPLLTAAGAGGVALGLLGLLGAAWALRRPNSARGRIVGLVALGMIGAGTSLVLQQTSTPGASGVAFGPSAFVASVASPVQVSLELPVLVQSAALTVFFVGLMPFPSTLFNHTFEANLEEIRRAIRHLPIVGRLVPVARGTGAEGKVESGWRHPLAIAAFVLVSALLYGLLDPGFGPNAVSVVTFLGIVAALVGVTWVAALPGRSMHRALAGDRGRLRAVPVTLVVAAACVLVSRVAGFLPGYLYGLILGYTFARELEARQTARAGALGAWWMLALALAAWFSLGALRTPGIEPSVPAAIAESVAAALVVGGIEGIVFGLVPLRFLPGEPVLRWRRIEWAALYGAGVFGFFWIILDPAHGFVGTHEQSEVITALALFIGFGLASVLFWSYFRFRGPRVPV